MATQPRPRKTMTVMDLIQRFGAGSAATILVGVELTGSFDFDVLGRNGFEPFTLVIEMEVDECSVICL